MPAKASKIVTLDDAVDSFQQKQTVKKATTLDEAVETFEKKKDVGGTKPTTESSPSKSPSEPKVNPSPIHNTLEYLPYTAPIAVANYKNKQLRPKDISVLQADNPIFSGQTGLNKLDTDEKKKIYSDVHNQVGSGDLDESVRNIVSKYPFATTKEGQASAKKMVDAFNTGNTGELKAYKDAIVSRIGKQKEILEDTLKGMSEMGGVQRRMQIQPKIDEYNKEIEKVNQVFTDYIGNVEADKKLHSGEVLLDTELKRLGEQNEKMVLGNSSFKQRQLLVSHENRVYQENLEKIKSSNLSDLEKKAAGYKLATSNIATENVNYDREKSGLEMVLNNLTMKHNDALKKALTSSDPKVIDQADKLFDQLKYYRDIYNTLDDRPEYADVRVSKTARFIGDEFVKRHGDLKIASADDIRKTALEIDKDNPGFLSKYGSDIDYLEKHRNMIPMAGFKGGAKAGLYEIGKGVATGFGYYGSDYEKAARDVNDEYKTNIKGTGWTEPTRVVFDKDDKSYRELPNEDYGKINWNNTFRFLGKSTPGLAEFILLDKGLGKAAKLVNLLGVEGLLSISKNAVALKGIEITAEELAAARKALSIGQGTQHSLGLYGAITITGHEQNRKLAEDLVDDNSTTGEAKKTLLANLLNLSTFAAFKMAGITPSAVIEKTLQKGIAGDALNLFEKSGWKLSKAETENFFNNTVVPKLKSIGSTLGKNALEGSKLGGAMVLDENTKSLIGSIVNPEKSHVPSLKDDAGLLINQVILMTAAGLPGLVNSGFTPTNKDALYEAGLKLPQQIFRITKMKEAGEISSTRADEMIAMSKTMAEEVAKVQDQTNEKGLPLTVKQKRDIAVANFRKRAAGELKQKGHEIKAEKISSEAEAEIKEIKQDNRYEEVKIDDNGEVSELSPEEKKAPEAASAEETKKRETDFTGKDNNFLANKEPDFFTPEQREQYNELMKKPETEEQAAKMVTDRKEELKRPKAEEKQIRTPEEVKPVELSEDQKIIKAAIDSDEIKGMQKEIAKSALDNPENATQFLKEVADQALNKVAPEAGDPSEDAKRAYGESIVNLAKERFPIKADEKPVVKPEEIATPVEVKPQKELSFEGVKRADAKQVYKEIRGMDEPTDATGLAYNYIAGGGKISAESILDEVTGSKNKAQLNVNRKEAADAEVKARDYVSPDGLSIKEAAHTIWDSLPEHLKDKVSDQDIRNALIDVVGSHNKRLDAANTYVDKYGIEKNLTPPEREYFEAQLPTEEQSLMDWINEDSDRVYDDEGVFNEEDINTIIDNYEQITKTASEGAPPVSAETSSKGDSQTGSAEPDKAATQAAERVTAAQSGYDKAVSDLRKAEDDISKRQATQNKLFPAEGAQKEMFGVGRDEAKEILDPLRKKVQEAKSELESAKKEAPKEQQPELFDQKPVRPFRSEEGVQKLLEPVELTKEQARKKIDGLPAEKRIEDLKAKYKNLKDLINCLTLNG